MAITRIDRLPPPNHAAPSTESFSTLYDRYARVVYARCRRLLGSRADAEDASQDVFLRLALHLERLPPCDPDRGAWVRRVTINHCFNELRNRRRRPNGSEMPLMDLTGTSASPERTTTERELVSDLMQNLPRHLALAACLRYVSGMNHVEVAQVLGCSRRTVFSYVAQFQKQARTTLEFTSAATETTRAPLSGKLFRSRKLLWP